MSFWKTFEGNFVFLYVFQARLYLKLSDGQNLTWAKNHTTNHPSIHSDPWNHIMQIVYTYLLQTDSTTGNVIGASRNDNLDQAPATQSHQVVDPMRKTTLVHRTFNSDLYHCLWNQGRWKQPENHRWTNCCCFLPTVLKRFANLP